MRKVGISVVNYRTAELVKSLIDSVNEFVFGDCILHLVVVDNSSQDGSAEELQMFVDERGFAEWITVVAAPQNGGFSYGNNIAFRVLLERECEYFWLLNPDTVVLSGACEKLIDCLSSASCTGIAGSALQDLDGTQQIASFHYHTPTGEFVNTCGLGVFRRFFPKGVVAAPIPSSRAVVDWVAGASMMIKRAVLDQLGLMDEKYFLYFEEVDYCLQASRNGFEVCFEPDSKVVHHVGAATGISDTRKQAPRRPKYWFDSRRRYFQKNFGFGGALWADLMWLLGFLASRLRMLVKGEKYIGPPNFFMDFIRQSSWVKGRIE